MFGLFMFGDYYPSGGINDLCLIFNTSNELKDYLDKYYEDGLDLDDNIQIIDFSNFKVVISGYYDDYEGLDINIYSKIDEDFKYNDDGILENSKIINKFKEYLIFKTNQQGGV